MPFVKIDDQEVFYQLSRGDQDNGITLLLIHGLGSSHCFYAPVISSLSKSGYNCLAVDTPGSGLSRFDGRDRSPKELAEFFNKVLRELGVDVSKVVVVGHSMGGIIASELAGMVGLHGAVLIGPVHPTPALADIFAQRIEKVKESGLEALADAIPTAATGSRATPTHRAFIRSLILSQTPEGYNSLCRTIANAQQPAYARAACALLVLAGSEDKTSPLTGCEEILASWGSNADQKQLQALEGVGHWHCIEAPEDVSRNIETFAKGLT